MIAMYEITELTLQVSERVLLSPPHLPLKAVLDEILIPYEIDTPCVEVMTK